MSRGADWDSYYLHIQEMRDMQKLAEAYLAEHPADEDEQVTVEWLPIGRLATKLDSNAELVFNASGYAFLVSVGHPRQDIQLGKFATRGDVRRLCKALGIESREPGKLKRGTGESHD